MQHWIRIAVGLALLIALPACEPRTVTPGPTTTTAPATPVPATRAPYTVAPGSTQTVPATPIQTLAAPPHGLTAFVARFGTPDLELATVGGQGVQPYLTVENLMLIDVDLAVGGSPLGMTAWFPLPPPYRLQRYDTSSGQHAITPISITTGYGSVLSPDGRHLAYTADAGDGTWVVGEWDTSADELHVRYSGDLDGRPLPGNPVAWLTPTQEIVVNTFAPNGTATNQGLWAIGPEGAVRELVPAGAYWSHPVPSPDGRSLLIGVPSQAAPGTLPAHVSRLALVDGESAATHVLATDPMDGFFGSAAAAWLDDGRTILVPYKAAGAPAYQAIQVIDVETGSAQALVDLSQHGPGTMLGPLAACGPDAALYAWYRGEEDHTRVFVVRLADPIPQLLYAADGAWAPIGCTAGSVTPPYPG